jgi:hypothetical protein
MDTQSTSNKLVFMVCKGCGEDKPESDFWFRNKKEGSRHKYCRVCYVGRYGTSRDRSSSKKAIKRDKNLNTETRVEQYFYNICYLIDNISNL